MSSTDTESDSDSSSSNDDSLSVTNNNLIAEQPKDDSISSNITKRLVKIASIQVPIIVSTMLMDTKRPHGGTASKRRYIQRDREERHELIMNDYFKESRCKWKTWLKPFTKADSTLRMLAYGCPADLLDEFVEIGESTAIKSLKHFCCAVIGVFEQQYLRKPNKEDVAKLLKQGAERGFPGMLGSLDCMHWQWKNCLTAWHGTHINGFKRVPTLILEVVASQDLWIWHAFFGMEGSINDINVLNRSPLFDDLVNGVAPPCNFVVQGHHYNMGCFLSDGICPPYATLIQTISEPSTNKERLFAERQEAARKDVEQAFGVLQSRWHIVKGPARMWNAKDLGNIMKTCIILHNMIIESELSQDIDPEDWAPHGDETVDNIRVDRDYPFLVSEMIDKLKQVQHIGVNNDLKIDRINHLWDLYGG